MSQVAHDVKEKVRTGDVLISENIDFNGLLLSEQVLKGLKNAGFLKPSPIQLKAIPLGRCGLDLIVQAKSGTGKTCVFSVIALETLHTDAVSTQVLVLAPTREIAVQIRDVINSIGSAIEDLQCHTFIGGLPLHEDKVKLKKCHIAVGSPGRVKQLIESGVLRTDSVRLFVLDEADKLLEESFQEQINWIYSTLPENKQMLALSATYPEYLADHLTAYMRNPTFLRLNISDPALLGIRQYYQTVKHHPISHVVFEEKCKILTTILSSVSFQQCLVFSNLQTRAQNLAESLTKHGWPTACIAGCLDQKDRNHAMEKLKTYKCRILISTDLTSRGIDADKVNLVINMDVPKDHETYLHRIGRAGRFGTFGIAVSLVSEGLEKQNLTSIEKRSNTHIHTLPDPLPSDLAKAGSPVYLDDMVSSEVINTGQHLNITKTGQIPIGNHGNTTVPETLIGSRGNTTAPGTQIGNHDNTTSPETRNESLPEANFTEFEIGRADKTSSELHFTSLSKNMSSESQNDSSVKSSHSEVSPGSYDMITHPVTQTSIIGNYDKPVSLQTAQEITSSSLISLHQKDLKKTPFSESETHKFHSSNCEDTLGLNQEPANQTNLSSGLFKNESNLSLKDLKSCTPTAAVNHKEQVFETSSLEFNTENGQFQHFSGSHCSVAPMYRIQDKNTSDISKEPKKKSFNKKTGYNSVCEEVNDHEVDTNVNDIESTTKTVVLQTDNQSKVNVIESEVTKVSRVPVERITDNSLYHKLRLGEINLSQVFKKGIGYKSLEKTHTYNSATQDLKSFRESKNFRTEEEIEKKPDITFVIPYVKEDDVIEGENTLQEAVEQLQDLFEQNINLVYRHGLEQNGIEEIENEEIHQVVKTSVEISTKDTSKLKLPKHAVKRSIDQIQEPDLEQFSDDYIGGNARIDGTSEYLEKENLFIACQSNSVPDKQKMVQCFPSESVTNQNNSNSNTGSKARRQRVGYQRNFAIGHMLQQERLNNVDKEVDSAAVETSEEMNINSGRGLDDFSVANFMEDEDSKVDNYSKLDRSNSNQSEQNGGTHGDLNGLNRFETKSTIKNYKKSDEIQVEAGNFCYAKDKPTRTEEHEAEARQSDTDETESEVYSSDYTADSESDSLEESDEEIKLAERKNEKSLKFREEKYFSSQSESVDYDSRAHHSLNAGEFRKQSYPTPTSHNAAPYYSCYPNGNYGYQYPGYNSYPAPNSHPQQPALYQHPSLPYQQFVPAFPQPYGHVNRHLYQTPYDSHSGSSLWYQQPWIYGYHGNSNAYSEQIAQNNDPSLKKTFDIQSEYIKKMCKNEDKSENDKKKKKHQRKYARN